MPLFRVISEEITTITRYKDFEAESEDDARDQAEDSDPSDGWHTLDPYDTAYEIVAVERVNS